jgi:hypothetical protein
MTYEARREYLEAIRERYQNSTKKRKGMILDEFCRTAHYSRKYAIRILSGAAEPRRKKPGPKSRYIVILPHLKELWEVLDRPCSKKLKVAIPDLLHHYKHDQMNKDKETKLKTISPAQIDRLLKPVRQGRQKGISGTKPLNWMKSTIPLELLHKEITAPGYVEADTVLHCGDKIAGEYAHTLTITDIASCWTVNRALWSKDAENVLEALMEAESEIPFPLTAFASDNGTELLNKKIHDYLKTRKKPVKMIRRRPYKKNDNAHVEQKNYTHVRQIFGYDRLDDHFMVAVMNEIYCAYWNKIHNFFIPTMKLVERVRVGGRIRKKYDSPKTPFNRIIENPEVPVWVKRNLKDQKKGYDPFKLKAALDDRMKDFVKLVEHARIRRKFLDKIPA